MHLTGEDYARTLEGEITKTLSYYSDKIGLNIENFRWFLNEMIRIKICRSKNLMTPLNSQQNPDPDELQFMTGPSIISLMSSSQNGFTRKLLDRMSGRWFSQHTFDLSNTHPSVYLSYRSIGAAYVPQVTRGFISLSIGGTHRLVRFAHAPPATRTTDTTMQNTKRFVIALSFLQQNHVIVSHPIGTAHRSVHSRVPHTHTADTEMEDPDGSVLTASVV